MKLVFYGVLFLSFLILQVSGLTNGTWRQILHPLSKISKDKEYAFLSDNPSISLKCRNAVKHLAHSKEKIWAVRMIDASAKIPSGIFSGHKNNYGDRDACIRIHGGSQAAENGRYYLVKFVEKISDIGIVTFLMEVDQYLHGFCLPQPCTPKDVSIGLQILTGFYTEIKIDDYHEHVLDIDGVEIAFFVIISIILGMVLIGTIYDLYSSKCTIKTEREFFRVAKLFSVISSTRELFSMPKTSSDNRKRLNSLDGLRFLSITWVLIGHAFQSSIDRVENSFYTYEKVFGNFWGQTVFNAFNSVDSFFLLSGLLVSYLTIKELERSNGRINWFLFYFHRFVRITLVYSIILFMFASVLRHVGPTNQVLQEAVQACRDQSWENLLYVENLVSQSFRCIGQGWYLNCDMQMFIITPLILYPLYRWRKIGLAIGSIFILGSTAILASFHYIKRDTWAATIFGSEPKFFKDNYTQPWMRIQPYIIGIFLGYFLYKTKGSFRMPKYVVIIGWILALSVGFASIYGLRLNEYFGKDYKDMPLVARIAYGSLHRLGWALAVGWVVFACENGYGGIINEFLSWKFFKPWSKITFLIFLTHMIITEIVYDNMHYVDRFSTMHILITILWSLNLSSFISAIFHVVLEVPFAKLEKYIVSKFVVRKKTY